jgi:hypothetical protein
MGNNGIYLNFLANTFSYLENPLISFSNSGFRCNDALTLFKTAIPPTAEKGSSLEGMFP